MKSSEALKCINDKRSEIVELYVDLEALHTDMAEGSCDRPAKYIDACDRVARATHYLEKAADELRGAFKR